MAAADGGDSTTAFPRDINHVLNFLKGLGLNEQLRHP